MHIKEISEFNSAKMKITLDNGIAFVLYKGDLSKYKIEIGEINDDIINEIFTEVLPKRALDRSLKIITGKDLTSGELKKKLEKDLYPEYVIEETVERLKNERLLNDERYIRLYIESKSAKKSKRDIMAALYQKDIDLDLAEKIYDELKADGILSSEEELIRKLLDKRHFDFENATFEDTQKQIKYLMGKGFSFDSIRSVLKGSEYSI